MADYSRPRRFVWFKYAFLCSWLIVVLAFTTLVTAAAALAALNTIASDICAEPEVASNSTSCRDRLKCFANCIDRIDAASGVVTSTRLRARPPLSHAMHRCPLMVFAKDATGWHAADGQHRLPSVHLQGNASSATRMVPTPSTSTTSAPTKLRKVHTSSRCGIAAPASRMTTRGT